MPDQNIPDEQQELKRRAVRRLIAALALIGLVIMGLAILDRVLDTRRAEAPLPAVVPPETTVLPAKAPEPVITTPTPVEPPPPPSVASGEFPRTTAKPVDNAPVIPESTGGAVVKGNLSKLTPKPSASQGAAVEPPLAVKPAEAPRIPEPPPRAYIVQLGVFTTPANAEALRERLARDGIEAHTETRLQVGPFKNKAEADAVMAKLKALDVKAVLVPQR